MPDDNAVITPDDGNDDSAGSDAAKDPEDVSGLKSAVAKEREARKLAAADAKKAKEERDALLAEKAERETAEAKAAEEAAAKKGEFEALAKKREGERDAAKQEAASLQAQVDQLKTAMEEGLATSWAALPDAVRKQGEELIDEDDVLARFAFIHKPSTQALVKELSTKAEADRGNGPNPKPGGTGARSVEDEAKALNQSGTYAM
jgi:hypothetical protein